MFVFKSIALQTFCTNYKNTRVKVPNEFGAILKFNNLFCELNLRAIIIKSI